jgi:hypothetical protein
VNNELCKQVWYADDSSSAGELAEMKKWWDELCISGPKYGYYPLPRKTILIVKPEHEEQARRIFTGSGVQITTTGERPVIGSATFKEEYVVQKISKWIDDVDQLAEIAKDEPQAAYSSFTKAVSHRWSYIQRTIPNISNLFTPLENAIRERLIPNLVGRKISDIERRIFALPVRLGGMGISDPTQTADHEFYASNMITKNLYHLQPRKRPLQL